MLKELEAHWNDSDEEVEAPAGLFHSSLLPSSQGPGTVGSIGKEDSEAQHGKPAVWLLQGQWQPVSFLTSPGLSPVLLFIKDPRIVYQHLVGDSLSWKGPKPAWLSPHHSETSASSIPSPQIVSEGLSVLCQACAEC